MGGARSPPSRGRPAAGADDYNKEHGARGFATGRGKLGKEREGDYG